MSTALLTGVGVTLVVAGLGGRLARGRASAWWLLPLLLLAGAWPLALLLHLAPPRPTALAVGVLGLGRLALERAGAGAVAGGVAALALRALAPGRRVLPAGTAAAGIALAGLATLALSVSGLVALAFALAAVLGVCVQRWAAAADAARGPFGLRLVGIIGCSLLAAAALLPSVRGGGAPAALPALALAAGLAVPLGLLPFQGWGLLAEGVPTADAALWPALVVPVALLGLAGVLVGLPTAVAATLQALVLGLGLASGVLAGVQAVVGLAATRYSRLLVADVALMAVAVATGTLPGLAGALILLVLHWIAGTALGAPSPSARAAVTGWLGVSGLPPGGAFVGRLLVLVAVARLGPVPIVLALLVLLLQLATALRGAVEARQPRAGGRRRLGPVAATVGWVPALGTVALGLVPGPVLAAIFGVHW
ncbi:MAG TPA: hypothetical protein VMW49_07135 [Candidatus Dormibacteraeota bacterium]|nr:hypothetical protein [Candidatus Dormibacteraeota bacterium]